MKKIALLFFVFNLFAFSQNTLKIKKDKFCCCKNWQKDDGSLQKSLQLDNNKAWMYCSVLKKRKSVIGLYQYQSISSHSRSDNFYIVNKKKEFLILGQDIAYSKVKVELLSLGFKEKKIVKALKRIHNLKNRNKYFKYIF